MFISKKSMSSIVTLFFFSLFITSFAGGHKKHHTGANHVGVFVGATSNLKANHTDLTIGLDYEYRANTHLGVGLIGDYIMGEHTEILIMAGVFYHPTNALKLYLANGFTIARESEELEGDSNSSHKKEAEDRTVSNHVLRLGMGYDFHLGRFSVTPTVAWDLITGDSSFAYGLTFGIGF